MTTRVFGQRIALPPDTDAERGCLTANVAKHPVTDAARAEGRPFEAIYAEHIGFVWRCLRGLGVAPAALDDAAQEVFIAVHRRLGEFRGESSLRTWLYAIIRNVASNQRRSQRRRGVHDAPAEEPPSTGPSPLERTQDREAAEFVQRFLAQVSESKREVFVLSLLEQMSMPEVSQALGIPLNTAYTRLRDVRLEFQRALQRKQVQR
jgi:RNA polymerase sigma-70 factor (ECF subfamily)